MTGASMRRRPVALAVVALLAVLALAVVLFVPLGQTGPGRVVVGGTPLYGKPAPEIDLPTLAGGRIRLSELRGRPVLVNFWATWCVPCRDEFPLLVSAYAEHGPRGLEILGIVHDDTVDGARRFAVDYGATWPMLDDADDVAWDDYLGVGMPQSYFIDTAGIVQAFSLGGFTEAGLAAQLALILPTPDGSPGSLDPAGSPAPAGPPAPTGSPGQP
ncbi:hypothetical protein BH23CHL8_BH23CHL8_16540 [soil metagenome]